ncbi:MAG: RsmD family RNA methyltransferase [Phycisphaerae bacterium]|nr:RsmD family RNA methyltransferase [Phycisphaerae bacterium]
MRIIAGTHRGRTILPPDNDATRPITDRVKQSLFDILAPRIEDAVVFDCFAGTGSMGLECLSRGAKHVTFFEMNRSAVGLLKRNLETLGFADRSTIVASDVFKFFPILAGPLAGRPSAETRPASGPAKIGQAHLIFLDPPYRMVREESTALQSLASKLADCLATDGVIIFRHDAADSLNLPSLECIGHRTYGGMTIELLVAPNAVSPAE